MFIWQTPPTWFRPLDQHERITARSSTQVAMWGSQSETQSPLWPCCFHFRFEASTGEWNSPIGVITGLKLGGSGLPASWLSAGLGSNRSMWLGPPSMNRKITLLAVAGLSRPTMNRSSWPWPASLLLLPHRPPLAFARQQVQKRQGPEAATGPVQPVATRERDGVMRNHHGPGRDDILVAYRGPREYWEGKARSTSSQST